MKKLLNSIQAKSVDSYSINNIGIPSVVLMERAALAVADRVKVKLQADTGMRSLKDNAVLIVCGTGNNGADGLAAGRLLAQAGVYVDMYMAGGDSEGTVEYRTQKDIIGRLTDRMTNLRSNCRPIGTYNYIIDALFGIGLNRGITGDYVRLIREINESRAYVFAVDAPSGIDCSTGDVHGVAIEADETITFGYNKCGLALEPGRSYAGRIHVADIGFVKEGLGHFLALRGNEADIIETMEDADIASLPVRSNAADKGKCGKVLIIAGSKDMCGAAVLSAEAALRSGCGLVKVFTHEANRASLVKNVVEAIPVTYDSVTDGFIGGKPVIDELAGLCRWADCIIVGPGLSKDDNARAIMALIMEYIANTDLAEDNRYVIMDADALNLVAGLRADGVADYRLGSHVVITPHVGEAARLLNTTIPNIKADLVMSAKALAREYGCTALLKDAVSVITDGKDTYINSSGNPGMATAGSGDVLTGVLAGVMCMYRGGDIARYAALGAHIHGRAGDMAMQRLGVAGMKAFDIAEAVPAVLNTR